MTHAVRQGGRVWSRGPARDVPFGYVVEQVDWYACTLPGALRPENQDGEVAQFRLLAAPDVTTLLEQDGFTIEAALVLLDAFAAPA